MDLWCTVMRDAGHIPALGTVTLRRYDRLALRVWALVSEKFSVKERQERLLEVTDGWLMLVERAAALVAAGKEEAQALTPSPTSWRGHRGHVTLWPSRRRRATPAAPQYPTSSATASCLRWVFDAEPRNEQGLRLCLARTSTRNVARLIPGDEAREMRATGDQDEARARANLLPEVQGDGRARACGGSGYVVVVGDGVNDSPAPGCRTSGSRRAARLLNVVRFHHLGAISRRVVSEGDDLVGGSECNAVCHKGWALCTWPSPERGSRRQVASQAWSSARLGRVTAAGVDHRRPTA